MAKVPSKRAVFQYQKEESQLKFFRLSVGNICLATAALDAP